MPPATVPTAAMTVVTVMAGILLLQRLHAGKKNRNGYAISHKAFSMAAYYRLYRFAVRRAGGDKTFALHPRGHSDPGRADDRLRSEKAADYRFCFSAGSLPGLCCTLVWTANSTAIDGG